MLRMKEPVRFRTCKHLQCTELSSWKSYSREQYGSVSCPICSRPGNTLIKDEFTLEILNSVSLDVDTVVLDAENDLAWSTTNINRTGSYESYSSVKINSSSLEPSFPQEEIWIDLTEDNTVYDMPWEPPMRVKPDPGLPPQAATTAARINQIPQTRPAPNFVDLTEDVPQYVLMATIHRPCPLRIDDSDTIEID